MSIPYVNIKEIKETLSLFKSTDCFQIVINNDIILQLVTGN